MLIIDGVKYKLWTPKDEEKDFHPMVKEHSKAIFGDDSIYFDVKHKLKSKSGIGSIPDAYVISLSKPYKWYVVENELASHPVYDHIIRQLTKFINGIKSQSTRNQILDTFYDEIRSDKLLRAYVETAIGSQEIHHFLSKLISAPPQIVVVIDQKTEEVEEACQVLKYETSIVEFKTFVRENGENVLAHIFEPLFEGERPVEKGREEEKGERKYPPHRLDWEKRLEWVKAPVRAIVHQLTERIERDFPVVNHHPHNRWYFFYRGESKKRDSRFAVLLITNKAVKVRIKTDPQTFKDEKHWTKSYKGWFFPKQGERGFGITDSSQMDYAMKLIEQSYELAK